MSASDPPQDAPLLCTHTLAASGGHLLHVQEFGNADGLPALVLHGGPGSGCSPLLRRFFDPRRYRIICPDQRGSGSSRPRGETSNNTTQDLLDDVRLLRHHLGLRRWLVVGGSWGATLALVYAAAEPDAVSGLLLRSTFLARRQDIDAFFRPPADASALEWRRFASVAPREHRHALLPWLAQVFSVGSTDQQITAALAWWRWEQVLSSGTAPPQRLDGDALQVCVDRYRVQVQYLHQDCWLRAPSLLQLCDSLPRVPTLLLHGSDDRVCSPGGAQALHRQLPHSQLHWVDAAGHDPAHPAMAAAMTLALNAFAHHADFGPANAPS